MAGCYLLVVVEGLEPQDALMGLALNPFSIFRTGERRFPGSKFLNKLHNNSGFKCDVAGPSSSLKQEVTEVIQFLKDHEQDLRHLGAMEGVVSLTLDFGYDLRIDGERCVVQYDYLPPELLKLCGSLSIGIELSLFGPYTGSA
jgi:hypothetical protein